MKGSLVYERRTQACDTCGTQTPSVALRVYRVPGVGSIKRCRPCDRNLKAPANSEATS